jgi:hypothetical protein
MIRIENNIVNESNSTQLNSIQESKNTDNTLEQRIYALAYKHFKRLDSQSAGVECSLETLVKKHELSLSELDQMENEQKKSNISEDSKLMWGYVISMKKTEIENIQSTIKETELKFKKIKAHPLHSSNRNIFLGGLATAYDDYSKNVKGEDFVDTIDPCDDCFSSSAKQGIKFAGVIKDVKQADWRIKKSDLEDKLISYSSSKAKKDYIATYQELCNNYSDVELKVSINDKKVKFPVNTTALESLLNESPSTLTFTLPKETSLEQINQCLSMIQEYLTCGQIETFYVITVFPLLLFMESKDELSSPKQLALAQAMLKSIEVQFFYALLEENCSRMERIAGCFDVDVNMDSLNLKIAMPEVARECLSFNTQGKWINKKLELIHHTTLCEEAEKKRLFKDMLRMSEILTWTTLLTNKKSVVKCAKTVIFWCIHGV